MHNKKFFFNGYTGFLVGIQNDDDKNHFDPSFLGEGFFAGQVDFFGRFFLAGEFYLKANDIFDYNIFEEENRNANFRIENLSATLKVNSFRASHYLNLYRGNFEPLGSDLFLQRQFGVSSICSSFTESYHGAEGPTYYPFFADVGLSYVLHPETNFAFGINIYKNDIEKIQSSDDEKKEKDTLCLDLRFAGLCGPSIIDFCAGLGLPCDTNTTDDESLLSIKELQFHCGLNLLVGNKSKSSLLIQAGINKLLFTKEYDDDKILDIRNIYAFVEASASGKIGFDMSGFLLPVESAKDMIFLRPIATRYTDTENLYGANLNIHKENVGSEKSSVSIGLHTTLAFSIIDPSDDNKKIKTTLAFSPYVGVDLLGGTLGASVSINFNIPDVYTDPDKCYFASIGFKRNF